MPAPEAARKEALKKYDVLDTTLVPTLEDLTRLAAQYCRAPYALVSFLDDEQETVLAAHGWYLKEMPRPLTFAEHVLRGGRMGQALTDDLFLVPDAREDERFCEFPFVRRSPHVCFYVGIPLVTVEGSPIGVLAVLDDSPKLLDDRQVNALRILAKQTMALLEMNRRINELTEVAISRSTAEESARWQARHDVLTGLPNRALFLERVEATLSMARVRDGIDRSDGKPGRIGRKRTGPGISILFADLDRFKRINDTLGHAAGDTLLREVAARFSGCLRPEDTLARLGGDEFIVLLPEVPTPNYAANVAQMLLRTLHRPIMIGTQEFHVGASVGIATYPRDGTDAATLLKHADIAMYKAKEEGGYQAYSHRMNADGYQRLIEEGDLRRAVERGDLSLVYQPQIETQTGCIVGVEALARWRHPERGMIPPAHFIALAEQADLIIPLGDLVLRRACRDAARWRDAGFPDVRVAVNLSARQISQPNLIENVARILAENGLEGNALELELTETALIANGDASPQTLHDLRSLGIRLAVDDFGTGYSSLAYLRRFRVDALKIDHAFVAGLSKDPTDEALVRALVEMAHALDLEVVAEGVETQPQCDFLRSLRCDYVQGYLFSRPLTYDALIGLLESVPTPSPDPPLPTVRNALRALKTAI
ncbi:MAG: EAL domain-containing protein [Capsulimonadales bacterium]|nr:EAL domain-containing protein [Capsulimonadales bacterium]